MKRSFQIWAVVGSVIFFSSLFYSSLRSEENASGSSPASSPAVGLVSSPTPTVTATPVETATPAATAVPTPAPTPETPKSSSTGSQENLSAEFIGAQACLACHTARQDFMHSEHARNFKLKKGIDFEKSCETCHGPGSLHAQAAGDKTNPGFSSINNLKSHAETLCLRCHEDQRRLHWASSTHNMRGLTCTSCHSVHSPKSPHGLLQQIDEKATCFQCHQDIKAQIRRQSHMPVLEGKMTCTDCHNPHGSQTPKMLAADSVTQLCYKCHAEKRGPFLWEHPPVRENCLNCHVPHGSHYDKMLKEKLPFLCQQCHNAARHPSTAYSASDLNSQNSRVFNQACFNCHSNVHGSNHPSGKFFTR